VCAVSCIPSFQVTFCYAFTTPRARRTRRRDINLLYHRREFI
jgi:hypothetical protein